MSNEASTTTTETAAAAEQGARVAPEQPASTKKATPKKTAPKGQKTARGTKPAAKKQIKPASKKAAKKETKPARKKAAKTEAVPREFSKKAIVIEMMRRKDGATLLEIAKATGWAKHSIRGFVSGQLTKKMGLKVESSKNDAGERRYRLAN
jgi:hypothetical protein